MLFDGTFPPPREFQSRAHDLLREGAKAGHRRQLVMAATGAGKTYLGMRVIHEALALGKRAMFICDRRTLITQTSDTADRYGLGNHSIIQADNPRLDLSKKFQIASVQTLERRGWPDVDVIVVDECHTLYKTWVDYIVSPKCKAFVIGLSATPFTKGLGKVFTHHVNAATMHELTELGVLVPMRVFTCRRPNMEGAETAGGEWTEKAAEERELVLVGDVISEWSKHARDRKTIVFGATIAHCEELCRQFLQAGIPAAVFTSNTKDDERKALLDDFRQVNSYTRVLISVEALAKGFDVPDVGCVCDCRPLRKSLSTAIQMWGRGLRSSVDTGKADCLLLDFSGNIIRFADDFADVFYQGLEKLDDGERLDREVRKDEEREPRSCPECGYSPMGKRCVGCGHEPIRASLVESLPGHMHEVSLSGKAKRGAGALAEMGKTELYHQLLWIANERGYKPGWAAAKYKDIHGNWPNGISKEVAEPSATLLNWVRSEAIRWAKSRRAA